MNGREYINIFTYKRINNRWFFDILSSPIQLTFSEPRPLGAATASQFEAEPVQGRKVSKVVKTTVVRGERMEKQKGDRSLAADLPSAREDFEKVSVSKGAGGKIFPS